MANIWFDRENAVSIPQQSTKKGLRLMSVNSAIKQSVKKNVLTDLNNVIHNKHSTTTTPFRSAGIPLKSDILPSATKSLHKNVLRKEQNKLNFRDAQQLLEHKLKPLQSSNVQSATPKAAAKPQLQPQQYQPDPEFFDFSGAFCANNCEKSVPEIWANQRTFSDDIMQQLLTGVTEKPDAEQIEHKKQEFIKSIYVDDDMDNDLKEMNTLLKENFIEDENDISKTIVKLPDFDDLDFHFSF